MVMAQPSEARIAAARVGRLGASPRHDSVDRVMSWTRRSRLPLGAKAHPVVQQLKPAAKELYDLLWHLVGRKDDGRTVPTSWRFLARLLGLARRSVRRSGAQLVAAGLLVIHNTFDSPRTAAGEPVWDEPGWMPSRFEPLLPNALPKALLELGALAAGDMPAPPAELRGKARKAWREEQELQRDLDVARGRWEAALPALSAAEARRAEIEALAAKWRAPLEVPTIAAMVCGEVLEGGLAARASIAAAQVSLLSVRAALEEARRWEGLAVDLSRAKGRDLVCLGQAGEAGLDWRRAWTSAQVALCLAATLDEHVQAGTKAHNFLSERHLLHPPKAEAVPTFGRGEWRPPAEWRPEGERSAKAWRASRITW